MGKRSTSQYTLSHQINVRAVLEDRNTHHLDQQFMLGPSLLVAPSFVPETEFSEYYLPAGNWTSFFNPSRVVRGPKWVKEKIALDDIALWVREGSVLSLGPPGVDRPDYSYGDAIELRIYEVQHDMKTDVIIPSGQATNIASTIHVSREGRTIRVVFESNSVKVNSVEVYSSGRVFTGILVTSGEEDGRGFEVEVDG